MKQFLYILIFFTLFSCDEKSALEKENTDTVKIISDSSKATEEAMTEMAKQTDFIPLGDSLTYIYLSQLPRLSLPFEISTEKDPPNSKLAGMNEDIYEMLLPMGSPYGKLMEHTNYAVVVHTVPTDIWFPILYSIDYSGKLIDTLNAFECGGGDVDYQCMEYFTVDKNGLIEFIDSTYHYDLDPTGNRIESSKKLEIKYKTYRISDNGIFEQFEAVD